MVAVRWLGVRSDSKFEADGSGLCSVEIWLTATSLHWNMLIPCLKDGLHKPLSY